MSQETHAEVAERGNTKDTKSTKRVADGASGGSLRGRGLERT